MGEAGREIVDEGEGGEDGDAAMGGDVVGVFRHGWPDQDDTQDRNAARAQRLDREQRMVDRAERAARHQNDRQP